MSEKSVVSYLSSPAVQKNIQDVLGSRKSEFITSVTSLASSNDLFADVEIKSLFTACLKAAALELPVDPSLGFAWIIPYKGKDGIKRAQFQIGAKGFVQLAQRSGQFQTINVSDVREGELFQRNRLTGEFEFQWLDDDIRDKTPIIGYVSYMRLTNGFSKTFYMTKDQLTKHASRYSQSFKRNASNMNMWRDDFDSMANKTVLKLMLQRYAPLKTGIPQAAVADQAVITDNGFEYPDNQPVDPNQVSEEKERERVINFIKAAKTTDELENVREAVNSQDEEVYDIFEKKYEELKTN